MRKHKHRARESRLERRNIDSQAAFHPGMVRIGRVCLELAGGEVARFSITAIVPALLGCAHAFAAVVAFRYYICVHDWSFARDVDTSMRICVSNGLV